MTAESRLDRLRSRTVRAVERQASSPTEVDEEVAVEEVTEEVEGGESSDVEPKTEEDGEPKSDAKEQPSPPSVSGLVNHWWALRVTSDPLICPSNCALGGVYSQRSHHAYAGGLATVG